MNVTTIGGKEFTEMLRGGAKKLETFRQQVNDLNVFPIPDGDTGDNMLMTFGSGKEAAESVDENLQNKAKAAASGMLLGARGNSGVILSRIFAGITKVLSSFEQATVLELKEGMNEGVKEAYKAVSVPVEGTILTVFKDAVNYANERTHEKKSITSYLEDMLKEMEESLNRTPELLPVLKEAGVVDSGGAGLLIIFEGMLDALNGINEAEKTDDEKSSENFEKKSKKLDFSLFTEDDVLEFGYCTEFLLRLQNCKIDVNNFDLEKFKEFLNQNGESVVAFSEGSIVKVHVHTKTPSVIIEFAQRYGEFLTFKMENMTFQNNEAVARGNNAQATLKNASDKQEEIAATDSGKAPEHSFKIKARKKNGIAVVAAGKGIEKTFLELGVDVVVEGGQCMNPSAGDLIKAFDEINADRIFVFPNNGNVILTAKQAQELYDKSEIVIVPTHTVGEGYAAVSMMDTDGDSQDILNQLEEVVSEVVTGFVSIASRNAEMNGVSVVEGDYLAFSGDTVYTDEKSAEDALKNLCQKLNAGDYGVMLFFAGETANEQSAKKVFDELSKLYPDTEIIYINGGQPIYDYMIVLE